MRARPWRSRPSNSSSEAKPTPRKCAREPPWLGSRASSPSPGTRPSCRPSTASEEPTTSKTTGRSSSSPGTSPPRDARGARRPSSGDAAFPRPFCATSPGIWSAFTGSPTRSGSPRARSSAAPSTPSPARPSRGPWRPGAAPTAPTAKRSPPWRSSTRRPATRPGSVSPSKRSWARSTRLSRSRERTTPCEKRRTGWRTSSRGSWPCRRPRRTWRAPTRSRPRRSTASPRP